MIQFQNGDEKSFPTMVKPVAEISSLEEFIAWTEGNREQVLNELQRHGALLFRGFGFTEASVFQRFSRALCPVLQSYAGGNSPRSQVADAVFTSTEYPRSERISLHNEASYLKEMPHVIMFYCQRPASAGGQTPLADCRKILSDLKEDVRRRFADKQVRYVNNLHGGEGVGRSWQQAFESQDRGVVEQRLRDGGYQYQWKADGGLRTSIVCDAVARHPQTGEESWINQAEQWHPSSLPPRTRRALQSLMSEEDFPHHATFGDGSPLPEGDLEHIREVMRAEERTFEWQAGDVLVCDNLLVAHGRQPYEGERRVLVSLA